MRNFLWSSTLGPRGVPKDPPTQAELKAAHEALIEDQLADYIKNHLLSRGAPVGSA
jgi:hypothetical protein